MTAAEIAGRLDRPRGGQTLSNVLRKALKLPPVAVNLLREAFQPLPFDRDALAQAIKAAPLTITGVQGLDRAISSAGGISRLAVDEGLMLKTIPDTYVVGEMLDWEAPTGGYLLQACFASAVWASRAILAR
jgi:predicted flavoprotein YhiN